MLNGKFTIYPILGPSVCPSQVIFVNISIAYKISFFNKKRSSQNLGKSTTSYRVSQAYNRSFCDTYIIT